MSSLLNFFESLKEVISPELLTILLSMLPVFELRLAIPFAISGLAMDPIKATLLSLLGNIAILLPVIFLYKPLSRILRKHSKLFSKLEALLDKRIRHKLTGKFKIYGALALTLFVAIPLPGTGGWTGAIAAYIFDIKPSTAFFLISLGILIAAILVMSIWTGTLFIFCNALLEGYQICTSILN